MKSIIVQLDEKTVEVSKLPLGKYAELLKALDQLPQQLENLTGLSNSEVFPKLPEIIANSIDDIVKIVIMATNMSDEEIRSLALDEVIKLLLGVVEVNRYGEIYSDLKKIFAPSRQQEVKQTISEQMTG